VIKKTLNPVWNETFGFDLPLEEVRTKKIRLAVWDYDFGPTNDYIGEVSIKLADICTNQKEKKIESHKLINKKRKGRSATIDVAEPPSMSSSSSSSSSSTSSHHRPPTLEEGKEEEEKGTKEIKENHTHTHTHHSASDSPSQEQLSTQQQQEQPPPPPPPPQDEQSEHPQHEQSDKN